MDCSLPEGSRVGKLPGLCAALLFCLAAAACNEINPAAGGAPVGPSNAGELELFVDRFTDGTIDLTVDVTDAASLQTILSASYLTLVTPFSVTCALSQDPVSVTVTAKFHLDPAAAIRQGTNAGSGNTTLDDPVGTFYLLVPPLFVVNAPATPTILVDVLSVTDSTHLALASAFPSGSTYYLYTRRPVAGLVTCTRVGVDSRPFSFTDNTLATMQFTTQFAGGQGTFAPSPALRYSHLPDQ